MLRRRHGETALEAARAKLAKNGARYPVDKARGSRAKYSDLR